MDGLAPPGQHKSSPTSHLACVSPPGLSQPTWELQALALPHLGGMSVELPHAACAPPRAPPHPPCAASSAGSPCPASQN